MNARALPDGRIGRFETGRTNALLMKQMHRLGYVVEPAADLTAGLGVFWGELDDIDVTLFDIEPKREDVVAFDFRLDVLPMSYATIVVDPPYKLCGRPSGAEIDNRYGVVKYRTPREIDELYRSAIACAAKALTPTGSLLVKSQDQIVGGKLKEQSLLVRAAAAEHGLRVVDKAFVNGYRPQPAGRSQKHFAANMSELTVLQR